MDQNDYDTLSEAVEDLKRLGYQDDFELKKDCIVCNRIDKKLNPEDFTVDQMYRFEGMSSTGDNSVLYAISSSDGKLKGLIVDAYGTYADPMTMEMLQKLKYDPTK